MNRTEPDLATTRPKSAGRTASNREMNFSEPNRTEPNRGISKITEAKRIESNRFLPALRTRQQRHYAKWSRQWNCPHRPSAEDAQQDHLHRYYKDQHSKLHQLPIPNGQNPTLPIPNCTIAPITKDRHSKMSQCSIVAQFCLLQSQPTQRLRR